MSTSGAIAIVVLVLVVINVWVHVGPRAAHSFTGPLAAGLLLLVGRSAGLSWDELGLGRDALARGLWWGAVTAGLIAAIYAVGVAVPASRRFFRDTRYRIGPGSALYTAFVAIPLGTVVFEEVAFRSVLWGLLEVGHGAVAATVSSSLVFGWWRRCCCTGPPTVSGCWRQPGCGHSAGSDVGGRREQLLAHRLPASERRLDVGQLLRAGGKVEHLTHEARQVRTVVVGPGPVDAG